MCFEKYNPTPTDPFQDQWEALLHEVLQTELRQAPLLKSLRHGLLSTGTLHADSPGAAGLALWQVWQWGRSN